MNPVRHKKVVGLALELQKGAIEDAVREGLRAEPVALHLSGNSGDVVTAFAMIGGIYTEQAAIEHILGKYSWRKKD